MSATLKGGDRLIRRLQEMAQAQGKVRAGILENATNHETGEPIAPYAAFNEYGTADIPARPFMRSTIQREGKTWSKGLVRMLTNGRDVQGALKLTGMRMAEDIQATINSNMAPPNSPATIRAKTKKVDGGDLGETMTPGTLIDTGSMIRAVDYEVEA